MIETYTIDYQFKRGAPPVETVRTDFPTAHRMAVEASALLADDNVVVLLRNGNYVTSYAMGRDLRHVDFRGGMGIAGPILRSGTLKGR